MTDLLVPNMNQFMRNCDRLGLKNPGLQFFSEFLEDKRRHYHGITHIDNLRKLHSQLYKQTRMTDKEAILVDLAIFWHDLIYDPFRKNNEWASAKFFIYYAEKEIFERQLKRPDLKSEQYLTTKEASEVYQTILSTTHAKVLHTRHDWSLYMLDLDLAGIGSDPETFDTNTKNILAEYDAFGMKESLVIKGRVAFWKFLKDRGPIFHNPYNLDYFKYAEVQASKNIDRELAVLEEMLTEFNHG